MSAALPTARPLYLDVAGEPVFGMFHAPADGVTAGTAVLICAPWGWDEVASYRSRRAWAEFLAERGHPTLRIDLPGSGDSGGIPADPELVRRWTRAIAAAGEWLGELPGLPRVAAIGLGLGGLLTAQAIADGAPIEDLVLWATPSAGRAFVREQRAFAALQGSRVDPASEPTLQVQPAGSLEVGGFILSAESIAALNQLELTGEPLAGLGRVLLLERDGMGHDRALEVYLAGAGVEVTSALGPGWSDMVFHLERYAPPVEVFGRVADWLAGAPPGRSSASSIEPPRTMDRAELGQDRARIRETPIRIDQSFGQIFGVLAEPIDVASSTVCAVFLNAGAVRRIGPNRLWVEAARRWSARGIPTIRMDLEGIGDADGDPARYRDVGNLYTPEFGAQVTAVLDELEGRGFGPRFVLIGLCAGAYWAFHIGALDRRIFSAIIVNTRAMIWDSELLARREARKVERLLKPGLWRRVLRGDVPVSRILEVSRALAKTAASAVVRAPGRIRTVRHDAGAEDPTTGRLDALRDRGARVVLAFSGEEPVYDELKADGTLGRLQRWPNVVLEKLPGRDHTLRPMVAQRALHDLLDRELELLLAVRKAWPTNDPGPPQATAGVPRITG